MNDDTALPLYELEWDLDALYTLLETAIAVGDDYTVMIAWHAAGEVTSSIIDRLRTPAA